VGYLFYYDGHEVELRLHKDLVVRLPMAVHLLIALALGAGLVLAGGMVRSMLAALEHSGKRRRERRRNAVDRLRQEGRSRLWSGEFESAEKTLEKVVRREPEDLESVLAPPGRSRSAASSSAPSRSCRAGAPVSVPTRSS